MRYFNSAYQEIDGVPDDAQLLVTAVGTDWVRKIQDALAVGKFPYITAAARKDKVHFYVQKDRHDEIREFVKCLTSS